MVRAVIELGQSLDMWITAEGVENQEQLDRISGKGCDEAQGFLFSKSVPPDEVSELIVRLVAEWLDRDWSPAVQSLIPPKPLTGLLSV